MPVVETFFGYVETTKDSLLLLEACRQGVLPRVRRRLQEQERPLVKSGAVFCFDENESGIKRWTDGLVWSPSRILGNFLIYRELDDKRNITDDDDQQENNTQQIITSGLTLLSKRQRERSLVGSLRNSYRFKPNGLIKKSLSVVVNGVHQHLVSYYNKDDIVANKFKTPSDIPELAMLEISSELLDGQNFRIPFFISNDATSISTTNTALSGDKRTTAVKTSTPERPTKQKKRASYALNNTPSRRYSIKSNNNDSLTSSPRYSGNMSSLLQQPSPTSSSSLATTTNYNMSMQDDQQPACSSTYHQLTYPQHQPQHLISPLTEPSRNDLFFSHQNSNENQSMMHHLSPPGSEGCQSYMTMYKDTTATKSPGGVESSPNNYYPHQLDISSRSSSRSSSSSTPPTSYGVGSDAHHHHQQWAPHSFSTGYSNERLDQNPHQHLFFSSSFHAINHAAIPTRTTELVSNAFMLDTNALLGSGWNDFEMQM